MNKKQKKGLITGLIVGGAIFSVSSILINRKRKKRSNLFELKQKRPWWKRFFSNH